ncbi:MAG TPA: hypothetical protein VM598_07265 [Bdellovibrionota bacterium]|nr:hypothetical protein [Bdellovibrionota bacterium]
MKPSWSRLLLSVFIAAALVAFVKLRPREEASPEPRPSAGATPEARPSAVPGKQGDVSSRAPAEDSPAEGAPDRKPASRSPAELFVELLRRGEWSEQQGAQGAKTGFIGKPIPGSATDAAGALDFARAAARQLGVSAEQLSQEHMQADLETGMQTVHRFDQWVDGYEVFDAALRVLARRSDGAVYLVNSSLKPVDQAPNDPRAIDRATAQAIAERHYRDAGGRVVEPRVTAAVIYADSRPVELAWVFYVEVTNPKFAKMQALVGASSQRVVYETTVLRN